MPVFKVTVSYTEIVSLLVEGNDGDKVIDKAEESILIQIPGRDIRDIEILDVKEIKNNA